MHYLQVTINRDETTGIPALVGAWELPILEEKHSSERLVVGELVEFKNRPWPDSVPSEMARLNRLYGRSGAGDDAMSFAERVYGTGSRGIKALGAAIEEAREAAEKPKAKRGRKPKGAELIGDAATG